ncbi:MAG: hypothetical protein NTZ38_01660 [Candidatus Taylorbacteria bacterium]|nr:hypothetical protein [Candidatus Taylorbacteria bacterium]
MSKILMLGGIVFVAVLILAVYIWREEDRPKVMEAFIIPLKGSQAIFIRTPNNRRILINGGPNSDIVRVITSILPFYSRWIDMVIVTDMDDKNVSGLVDILERYKVERLIVPAVTPQSLNLVSTTGGAYSSLLEVARRKEISIQNISAISYSRESSNLLNTRSIMIGNRSEGISSSSPNRDLIKIDGITIQPLFPLPATDFQYSKASPPQLILKIIYGDHSFLLIGNASTKIQKAIASNGVGNIGAFITSLNGSADNISKELADQTRPKFLVYSKSMPTNSKSSKTAASSKSKKTDLFYWIMGEDRFNVREAGTVKIVSDGMKMTFQTKAI